MDSSQCLTYVSPWMKYHEVRTTLLIYRWSSEVSHESHKITWLDSGKRGVNWKIWLRCWKSLLISVCISLCKSDKAFLTPASSSYFEQNLIQLDIDKCCQWSLWIMPITVCYSNSICISNCIMKCCNFLLMGFYNLISWSIYS